MFSIAYIENKETPLNRINIVIMKKIQKELLLFQIEIYQVNNLDIFSPNFNLNIFNFDNLLNSISVLNINLQIKITKSINSRYIDIIDKYK
jgi:hypothetical protein